jgi:UDP-2,4-diacetamido-2,4,6-trideoxy-beta-L-altropyranose hydrolase
MTRVVIRCDASAAMGGGHLARCMALAHALKERGARIELASRGLPERVRELLVTPLRVPVHALETVPTPAADFEPDGSPPLAHAAWLPVPQQLDAAQTAAVLRAGDRPDWLIVDHYALDAHWERIVQPHVGRILVIDDLADRDHVCDALLDQNFFLDAQTRYHARMPAHAERLLGPRFALLREEFAQARGRSAERDGRLRRVFVCFGGFDGMRQTLRALRALEQAGLHGLSADVVISGEHPDRTEIEQRCRQAGWQVHFDVTRMAGLMVQADLAIGASGVMNWERAAVGVPAIVVSVAENQHVVAVDLAADRACIYLGAATDWRAETLSAHLRALAGTPSLLSALAARAAALTDGLGARRAAACMLPAPISLRTAQTSDCEAIYAWRNAESTRRYSNSTQAIALTEHRRWFERVLREPDVVLLVGEAAGRPVGVLRYDMAGDEATASVYMVPEEAGRGLGTALLRAGTQWLREHRPNASRVHAEIHRENVASLRAFSNAGYRRVREIWTLEL